MFPLHSLGEDDSCEWTDGPFVLIATIKWDQDSGPPEDRDCGFWPSMDPKADGFIGHPRKGETPLHYKRRFAAAKGWATHVRKAWEDNDWFYCGISVVVFYEGVPITEEYDHALWGIECNYPQRSSRYHPNQYLNEVARELSGEAVCDIENKLVLAWRDGRPMIDEVREDMDLEWVKAINQLACDICHKQQELKLAA